MSESTNTTRGVERPGFYAWWSTRTGQGVALGLLVLVCAGVLFGQLSSLGIWEPWETDEIQIAREYARRDAPQPTPAAQDAPAEEGARAAGAGEEAYQPNWATPTLDGQPVARPLLKTWILAATVGDKADPGDYQIGELERSARLPFALAVFALSLLAFAWIRRYFDTWSALLGALAFVTSPAIFLGVHALSTEMLFVVLSSLTIMSFFELTRAETSREKWLWGVLWGVALALSFLEHRFFGLLSPVAVIVAFAVAELPFEQVERARQNPSGVASPVGKVDIALAVAALLGVGAVLLWGLKRSDGAEGDAYFLPHVVQWIAILVPTLIVLAGAFLARNSRAGRALSSVQAVAGALICAAVVFVVVKAYGAANPLRLLDGDISGKIPLLSFLLENRLAGTSPAADHMYFAMWVREIGFSLMPWIALVPLGIGYLSLAARVQDEDGRPLGDIMSPRASLQRLLLVWSFVALAVVALGSGFNHFYYPAYLPLLLGVGLMLGDAEFFRSARMRSLVLYAMGFAAVAIIMMLGKDLERFPDRFMEPYLSMQEELGLPADYSFGSTLKAIKYGWALLLATFFFGLVSWAGLTLRSLREAPARFKAWRQRRKEGGSAESAQAVEEEAHSPLYRRAMAKEAYRAESGPIARVAALVELPGSWAALVSLAAVVTAGIFLYQFAPEQSLHLSQRGIFEAYTRTAAPGERLYRYSTSGREGSVYLGDVDKISKHEAFVKDFDQDERYFVIMPRDQLAAVNYEVRKRTGRNLPVLDASSSKLILASNQLKEGETQQNFVADAMVDDPEAFEPAVPLQYANRGAMMPPTFDHSLELIGWEADRLPADGSFPAYRWGEKARLTFFFRVKKRVARSQKIFMHVDRGGSRLHGDHEPVGGDLPTNYWLPGDIIRDEYELPIESYTTPGVYTIWLGFYRGNSRMKVQPSQAHDGENRVRVGQIIVNRL